MQSYSVTLHRENSAKEISDTHYYVILDVNDPEVAKSLAMSRAREDYPEDSIDVESCKENSLFKKNRRNSNSIDFLLRRPEV